MGKSAFPENHALSLGCGGGSRPDPVVHFLDKADLIVGLGTSFTRSDYITPYPVSGRTYAQLTNCEQETLCSGGVSGRVFLTNVQVFFETVFFLLCIFKAGLVLSEDTHFGVPPGSIKPIQHQVSLCPSLRESIHQPLRVSQPFIGYWYEPQVTRVEMNRV